MRQRREWRETAKTGGNIKNGTRKKGIMPKRRIDKKTKENAGKETGIVEKERNGGKKKAMAEKRIECREKE